MEKLLDVIERKDALVIALSDGHIRAVDLTALKPETEAEMSAEELCAAGFQGPALYKVLSEDMEQLQSCEYIFQEDAMWLRYGSKLHEELRDHRLQKLLDEEIYCEDESGMQ